LLTVICTEARSRNGFLGVLVKVNHALLNLTDWLAHQAALELRSNLGRAR
jgi:hypothetical protein